LKKFVRRDGEVPLIKWARTLALCALSAVLLTMLATSALGKKQTVKAGNLVVTVDGGFRPQQLPRTTPAPISLNAETTLKTADGSHPPAAKTLTLEFDKHAGINTRGLPTCSVTRLQNTLTTQAKGICGEALVGEGEAGAEIAFPEQPPFFAKGAMLVFNGRPKGGHKVLIFHVYARVPAPTTFVTTAEISKATGVYGTRTVIRIPTIVAGQGSLTFAKLEIKRTWTYKGKKEHLLLATCPTGRFFTRGDLAFADGTRMRGKVLRSCSPIG
jgi:hypothetical protein